LALEPIRTRWRREKKNPFTDPVRNLKKNYPVRLLQEDTIQPQISQVTEKSRDIGGRDTPTSSFSKFGAYMRQLS